MSDVSVQVFVQDDPTIADEKADGSLVAAVAAATGAVRNYDTDGDIPQTTYTDLLSGVKAGLQAAANSAGADVLVFVGDGNTSNVDKAAVEAELDTLDGETFVLYVVVSNQPSEVDEAWLNYLDDGHPKAAQIDVVYTGREDVAEVVGREIDGFIASLTSA